MNIKKLNEELLSLINESEQYVLDKTFRPIYVGDIVVHISGGWNSAVSTSIGKVLAIDTERSKIQVDKQGRKSWIDSHNCVVTLDRKMIDPNATPKYADGRPVHEEP